MRIVVIEDEERIQKQIDKIIKEFSFENECDVDTLFFNKYDKNLKDEILSVQYPKIYITDIELKNSISGIDIAKRIRSVDWDSEIIFITSHDGMFEQVHRNLLEVFEFIEKFQDFEKRLKRDLKIIYNKKADKKILKVLGKKVNVELYMKNITYIMREKEDRKVVIHTNKDVEFRVNSTLAEIKEQLDSRFVQTHKSCIINKDYIVSKNYTKGYVDLSTGLRLFCLSRNFKDEVEK